MKKDLAVSRKTQKRRNEICNMIKRDGNVQVAVLSEYYGISTVSIRKDLASLEEAGMLRRIRGGAVANDSFQGGMDVKSRCEINQEKKKKVAQVAANLIEDGESVIINVGSTTSFIVDYLGGKKNLVVITNAFSIAEHLQSYDKITTLFLGGRIDTVNQVTMGESVIEQLSKYSIDKLIMGADGIDPVHGITSANHIEDYIIHRMISQSKMKILVADDTKLGKAALIRVADISSIDMLVTNHNPQKETIIESIRNKGIEVIQT